MMMAWRVEKQLREMGVTWGSTLTLATPALMRPLLQVELNYFTETQAYGAAGERG